VWKVDAVVGERIVRYENGAGQFSLYRVDLNFKLTTSYNNYK